MPFEKGAPGRPKGAKNKITEETRALFTEFVGNNLPKLQELWEQVADEDPAKAIELLDKLSAYTIPKLKAIEHSGDMNTETIISFKDPEDL